MSTESRSPTAKRAPTAWIAFVAALFGEYALLAVSFDVAEWLRHIGLEELRLVRHFGPALLTGLVATVVVGGRELAADVRDTLESTGAVPRRGLWLSLHVCALGALIALSAHMFRPPFPTRSQAPALIAAWLVLGFVAVGLLVRGLLPVRPIGALLQRHHRELALGGALAVLAHQAGELSEQLWIYTARPTLAVLSTAAGWVLPIVHVPEEHLLGTDRFLVQVAAPCSGYEGVGLITIFIGGYIALFRHNLQVRAALWVLPLGMAVMWLANIARIVTLLAVGHYISPTIALDGFHANLGWLLFLLTALSLVTWLDRSPRFQRAPGVRASIPAQPPLPPNPVAGYLAPLMALIFVALVTDLVALELDWWYGLRVVAGSAVLWLLRHDLPAARWPPAWLPVALGVAVFAMWLALVPPTDGPSVALSRLRAAPFTWQLGWIVARVIGSVVLVPVVEELAFRGYLLRRLQGTYFADVPLGRWAWGPVMISSLAFGMLHQDWIAGLLAGIAFAFAQARRGLIADAVMAHAVANALIAAAVLLAGRWDLWL